MSYSKYVQTVLFCKLVSTLNQYNLNHTAVLFSFFTHRYTYTMVDPLNGQTNPVISYGIEHVIIRWYALIKLYKTIM